MITNSKIKVFLIGDKLIDQYIYSDPVKMSEEAPVLVLRKSGHECRPGGAANVEANLSSLGAEVVTFYGNKKSSFKIRLIAQKHQIIRLDDDNFAEADIPDDLEQNIKECDVVAISDYNKGVITTEMMAKVQVYAKKYNKSIFVDPYKDRFDYGRVKLIKPNRFEAESVTGIQIVNDKSLTRCGKKYLEMSGADNVVISLGSEGTSLFDRKTYSNRPYVSNAKPLELKDITGAGDTLFAVLIYIWSQPHFSKGTSLGYANKAAAIACAHFGTYAVSYDEVFNYEFNGPVSTVEHVIEVCRGKKVVLANGCFDLLHIGHRNTLKKAKGFGDILVVALNTDESVRKLKGDNRPVFGQQYRAQMLSELPYVDYVVYLDDIEAILEQIKPDVVVKGSDWRGHNYITAEEKYCKKYSKRAEYIQQTNEELECKARISLLRQGSLKDMGASGLGSSYHVAERPHPSTLKELI